MRNLNKGIETKERETEAENVGAGSRSALIYSKRLGQSNYNSKKFRIFAAK